MGWVSRGHFIAAPSPTDMQRGMEIMQKQMAVMSPELVEKAKALSPEINQFLAKVAMRHERRSGWHLGRAL
jgi:hypothetical protein